MKVKGTKQSKNSFIAGVGIGMVAEILLSILLTAGLTSLILNGKLTEQTSGFIIFTIRLLSVLLGGLIGTGISNDKILPVIGSISLGYLFVLIAFGIAVYNRSFCGFILSTLSVIAGALIVTLIRLKSKTRPKHKLHMKS